MDCRVSTSPSRRFEVMGYRGSTAERMLAKSTRAAAEVATHDPFASTPSRHWKAASRTTFQTLSSNSQGRKGGHKETLPKSIKKAPLPGMNLPKRTATWIPPPGA